MNPVECYSSYEYAVRPLAIHLEGERLEVKEVLYAWRDPQGKGFRVRMSDEQVFDLFYDLQADDWRIQIVG